MGGSYKQDKFEFRNDTHPAIGGFATKMPLTSTFEAHPHLPSFVLQNILKELPVVRTLPSIVHSARRVRLAPEWN
ncbi:ICE2 family protein [Aspergillus luchuensis]|uniref:ICE2 family protein n=1 Tax=Aspergillus kawachii TaxID=1069201 RepID=A0A146F750_ASPKA|nr:ICE2 family protein [Aspergillus luchuensis]